MTVFQEMKRADLVAALTKSGCRVVREGSEHTIYGCPCGLHKTALPRHRKTRAGVVNSVEKQLSCLPKGWIT